MKRWAAEPMGVNERMMVPEGREEEGMNVGGWGGGGGKGRQEEEERVGRRWWKRVKRQERKKREARSFGFAQFQKKPKNRQR